MKKKSHIGIMAFSVLLLAVVFSCCDHQDIPVSRIAGHWGCEQYISHRVDSAGMEKWDTSNYAVGPGCAYEIFFYETGKGLLKLNDSPAFIKEFSCNYTYDSLSQTIDIESSSWLYGLYGSLITEEDHAAFTVESLTDSLLVASWTNQISETKPFFERFFLKRID